MYLTLFILSFLTGERQLPHGVTEAQLTNHNVPFVPVGSIGGRVAAGGGACGVNECFKMMFNLKDDTFYSNNVKFSKCLKICW